MLELTAAELARLVGGRVLAGPSEGRVRGVSTDSRSVAAGQLFIPLKGERLDGHRFIEEAVEEGAGGALTEEGSHERAEAVRRLVARHDLWRGAFLVGVPGSSWEAFHRLAEAHRARHRVPVVAVTGSNGKTTTKELVARILGSRWRTLRSPGNFNNDVGLPLTLLELGPEFEALVVEMGMRGAGEIARLCRMARPSVGIVTNVGPVHLELLGSMEAITAAKAELVEALPQEGVAVLNAEDSRVLGMRRRTAARVVTFGLEQGDASARDVRPHGQGMDFRLVWRGAGVEASTSVRLPLLGRHNVVNAVAAAAAGLALGFELDEVAGALAEAQAPKLRLETTEAQGRRVINDAYNASPASMAAALEVLQQVAQGRKGAVLGDMLELGAVARDEHVRLGERAAAAGLDFLVVTGERAGDVAAGARGAGMDPARIHTAAGWEEAAELALALSRPGDTVLVKASRGLGLERVVARLAEEETRRHEP
ncbi:UDP-N-acetylmuramoyl-tripeptide--D-alanyl-D-alanine ligase [Limnochorda pilosa]|uniref:UDP-N-acetylmuramoyl-tripeptide--D-alanyl-D-alanine ligase n=1 Tax=Limnochorda pilosa TaxID=1555112 RepID=A0A0K2SKU3_LIMPI|nr:UDP-N-acetylmuramoyl-tripeptide--D-alanyl-D-alanine ligase [Limnochorda pilosa]BAS27710.1 UDP-N-acetylmuramoyl-tripeptide--D-alanyl-D-alanine ligase [Limnochorda pilosa]